MSIERLLPALLAILATTAPAGAAEPVLDAMKDGRCLEAVEQAQEQLEAQPDSADLWRLLGDAHRCRADARPAVIAYTKYLALHGSDIAVERLVVSLQKQLGALRIRLDLPRETAVQVSVVLPEEEAQLATAQADGSWLAPYLLPGRRPEVFVRGVGLEPLRVRAPAVPFGGEASLELEPRWLGLGTVELSRPPPPSVTVSVDRASGLEALAPGSAVEATPGSARIVLSGPFGEVETAVVVREGRRSTLDPTRWIPTRLTVTGAPAGSQLRLFLEAVDPPLEVMADLPAGEGRLDRGSGLLIAEPHVLDGLVGGSGSLILSHAVLGVLAVELALTPGAPNSLVVDAAKLPRAAAEAERYAAWNQERAGEAREARIPVIAGIAAGAAGALLSGIAWGVAAEQDAAVDAARNAALAGDAHADGAQGWFDEHARARQAEQVSIGLGATGTALGVAGFTVAGVFGARSVARQARSGWVAP